MDYVIQSTVLLACVAAALYVWFAKKIADTKIEFINTSENEEIENKKSVVVVLGSGGHTMEALEMMKTITSSSEHPFKVTFVVAGSDEASRKRVQSMNTNKKLNFPFRFETTPRARHVGQSWLTTPLSFLGAIPASVDILLRARPSLIFCNGPGTCLPLCIMSKLFKIFGHLPIDSKILYIESLARVEMLSLTGEIIYRYGIGTVVVQWPQLLDKYPNTLYRGILI